MFGKRGREPFRPQLLYRLMLAIDVEKYSRRNAGRQLQVQTDLRAALDACAEAIGLDTARRERQVNGDGELLVLPANIPLTRVVGDLPRAFARELATLNRHRRPDDRLRVRLAMHTAP